MSEGHHTLELAWKGFNILLFLGIVYWFGRKPIAQAFNNFFQSLTHRLNTSEEELKKARQEYEKAKSTYEDAKRRFSEQLSMVQETVKAYKEEEIKKANEMAQRIQMKAKEAIEIETKKAKQELYQYALAKAKEIAIQELQRSFQREDVQKSYIEKSLKALEAKQ